MFKGSLVALVTPFDSNNRVDFVALKRLIDFHVAEGSDGLVIAGPTGESATLDATEHEELIRRAVEIADDRLPIVAGTGSNSTSQSIALSKAVAGAGIAGYLLVVPYYNKPVQEGMYQHFTAVADAVDKPIILYNVPGRTVADLLPDTVARLAEHDNIVAIKEATGDIDRLKAIRERVDESFGLLSGDDFTVLSFIEAGGHGVVTVSGNVAPAAMAKLCRRASSGDLDGARTIDDMLQPLNKALFVESNPIPVKWAMAEMGLMSGHIRLPLTPYDASHHGAMRDAMAGAGVNL